LFNGGKMGPRKHWISIVLNVHCIAVGICIVAAVVITISIVVQRHQMISCTGRGSTIWVICTNQDCEEAYQKDRGEWLSLIPEDVEPITRPEPVMVCKQCGKQTVYRAVKCQKCGLVFQRGSVPNDFSDRCPGCAYSYIEQMRKEARKTKEKNN
jgi:hypothetical protein